MNIQNNMSLPKDVARSISPNDNKKIYEIYLVGLNSRHDSDASLKDLGSADWVYLMPHIVSEAQVFDFALFTSHTPMVDGRVASSRSSSVVGNESNLDVKEEGSKGSKQDGLQVSNKSRCYERSCSAEGLEEEAHLLLGVVKNQYSQSKSEWRPIIFVAYGLGGLVVKRAMGIANTDPRYYDIALRTKELVFIATPQNVVGHATWEDILDEMIRAAGVKIKGRKSTVLAGLANSVSKAVSYFHHALRYHVTNLQEHNKPSGKTLELDESSSSKLPTSDDLHLESPSSTKYGPITDLDFRGFLFPGCHMTHYTWDTERVEASLFYSNLLDFLQVLSPSNRLIHQSTALYVSSGSLDLSSYTGDVSEWQSKWSSSNYHSIQVVGPPGCGKVTLVKLIAQDIMLHEPNAPLLDLLLEPFEMTSLNLQVLLRSFVHQILSQRPALFYHVRPFYLQHYKSHNATNENVLWALLRILLRTSRDWKIVIIANNVHLWPSVAQSSLKILEEFFRSLNYDYLSVSSSAREIFDLCATSRQVLDLGLDESRRNSLIQTKIDTALFVHPALQTLAPPNRSRDIRIPELSSLTNAGQYAKVLSRGFLLSTIEAVDAALRDCPRTGEAVLNHCIETPNRGLLCWSNSAISWVQKAARPLRTGELAVAITLDEQPHELTEPTQRNPISIEIDIARRLDLMLRVDNDFVYFNGAKAQNILDDNEKVQGLQLLSHGRLAYLCLRYISEILSKEPQHVCLAHMSWREQIQACHKQQVELEFLDYAVRHWPTHYHAHIQQSVECAKSSQQLEEPTRQPQGSSVESDNSEAEVLAFLVNDSLRNRWYRLFCVNSRPEEDIAEDVGILEVATTLGLSNIVESLLRKDIAGIAENATATLPDFAKLLHIAVKRGHTDLIDLFLHKAARRDDAVLEAASLGRVDYLEKLLSDDILHDDHERLAERALHRAAQVGSLPAVKFFDSSNVDWNWIDSGERTVVHSAAVGGNEEIFKHIISRGVLDLDRKDKDEKSPLIIATQLNHTLFVAGLCEQGADATLADKDGRTALHYAIFRDPDIMALLLQHNASSLTPDKEKETPLHFACQLGNLDIFKRLIGALNDEELTNVIDEEKPSLRITSAGVSSTIIQFLLDEGVDRSAKEDQSQKPTRPAAVMRYLDELERFCLRTEVSCSKNKDLLIHSLSKGHLVAVWFLLGKIVNVDFIVDGESPLTMAASKGYDNVVGRLLKKKANPNFADRNGDSPLHRAVIGGHVDVARSLLIAGAGPNSVNKKEWTPLHYAASGGMIEMVEVLLANKADIYKWVDMDIIPPWLADPPHVDSTFRELRRSYVTPLHIAIKDRHIEIIKLLIKRDNKLVHKINNSMHRKNLYGYRCADPPFLHALKWDNLEVARFILAEDPAATALVDSKGVSAFHMVAANGCIEILDELIQAFGHPYVKTPSKDCRTPLHYAIPTGNEAMIQRLLDLGSDIDAVDEKGETALYYAVRGNLLDCVKFLLNAGANPNICNEYARVPLHAAASKEKILDALLSHGAEVDFVDGDGETALMIAVRDGNELSVRTLLCHKANVNAVGIWGSTALHCAERIDNPIFHEILLDASADVNIMNADGYTPLHYAALRRGKNSAIRIQEILRKGAEVNCKNSEGNTPLHLAADDLTNLSILIEAYHERGLNIDEKNKEKKTPLHLALSWGNYDTSKLLLDKGASIDERDSLGNSCLSFANSRTQMIELLLKIGNDREAPPPWTLEDKIIVDKVAVINDVPADQDGWTIEDFLSHQSWSEPTNEHILKSTVLTPTRLIIPDHWEAKGVLEQTVSWSPDHREVQYSHGRETTDNMPIPIPLGQRPIVSVRADHPFPPRNIRDVPSYFEVEILPAEEKPKTKATVCIGLSGEFTDMSYAFPGRVDHGVSIGYHGDTGYTYRFLEDDGTDTRTKFAEGNTVGCGVDWEKALIYYMVDGQYVGDHPIGAYQFRLQKMYPVISMHNTASKVRVNFGEKTDEGKWNFKYPHFIEREDRDM